VAAAAAHLSRATDREQARDTPSNCIWRLTPKVWREFTCGPRLRPRHVTSKTMGCGLDHFRKEGAKLVPEPTASDPYIEAWEIKRQGK